jgi:xanthine dehydrogenase accessory factor
MEKHIIKQIVEKGTSKPSALCSVVQWKGSVPRKDYPWMMVDDQKATIGTIGGGRMEFLSIQHAELCIKENLIRLNEFDLSSTDPMGQSSVCGGKTLVLIEPLTDDHITIFKEILTTLRTKNSAILVTELEGDTQVSANRTLGQDASRLRIFPDFIIKKAKNLLKSGGSVSVTKGNKLFLIQSIKPDPVLHIFGGGHVGQAVAELATYVNIDYNLYENRKDIADEDRFPDANNIYTEKYGLDQINNEISEHDFVFIATHGHKNDLNVLQTIINIKCAYLGVMCSKNKWQVLSKALVTEGVAIDRINNIYAPVGLDIGSETVPEIAVSVIAEIINNYRKGDTSAISLSGSN